MTNPARPAPVDIDAAITRLEKSAIGDRFGEEAVSRDILAVCAELRRLRRAIIEIRTALDEGGNHRIGKIEQALSALAAVDGDET